MKFEQPSESADPNDSDGAGANGSLRPAKASLVAKEVVTCGICGTIETDSRRAIRFSDYETGQRDLLSQWVAALHPDMALDGYVHLDCIEEIERALQRAQIQMVDEGEGPGRPCFIDLKLGVNPILPTPIRMDADLRFTGRGVTIAFVDSGFYPHNDLMKPTNRVIGYYDAITRRELKRFDLRRRRDPRIEGWHGTMTVAASAGSGDLSHGRYRGIASESRLVLVKAMTPAYRIQTPQVVEALTWIRDNRVRHSINVVNLSLGVDDTATSLDHPVIALVEELVSLGVVVVAASGNNPSSPIKPPGSAPSAITVGGYNDNNSTDWMRREVWHSSYLNTLHGGVKPELLAPSIWVAAPILPRTAVKREAEALFTMAAADDREIMLLKWELADRTAIARELRFARRPVHIRSLVLNRIAVEKQINADYKHVDGTSFAAPIITSVVAQMLEANPDLTPADIKTVLCGTAVLLPDVSADVQGYGVVHPGAAVAAVVG